MQKECFILLHVHHFTEPSVMVQIQKIEVRGMQSEWVLDYPLRGILAQQAEAGGELILRRRWALDQQTRAMEQ